MTTVIPTTTHSQVEHPHPINTNIRDIVLILRRMFRLGPLTLSVAAASIALSNPVWSASWRGNSGVQVVLEAAQSSTDSKPESEQTSSIVLEPFYQFSRLSRMQAVEGKFGVRHQRFSDDGGQSTAPSLAINSRTTLINRGLWLNARADATSRRISSSGFSDDRPVSDEQTSSALQLELIPEFRYQASDRILLSSKAGVSNTQYSGDGDSISDNTTLGAEGSLLWALGRPGYFLTFGSRYQVTEFDSGEEATLGSIEVGSLIPIDSRLSAYARLGYDQVAIDGVDNVNQKNTTIGIRWRPDRRFELNAEYAERAFGRQPTVAMILMGRRSQLEFRWSRDLQIREFINTDVRSSLNVEADSDENLDTVAIDGLGLPASCESLDALGCTLSAFIANAETVKETIEAIYTLRGRVSTASFAISRTELTDFDGGNNRERDEAQLSFSRALAQNLKFNVTGIVSHTESFFLGESANSQIVRTSIVWLSK